MVPAWLGSPVGRSLDRTRPVGSDRPGRVYTVCSSLWLDQNLEEVKGQVDETSDFCWRNCWTERQHHLNDSSVEAQDLQVNVVEAPRSWENCSLEGSDGIHLFVHPTIHPSSIYSTSHLSTELLINPSITQHPAIHPFMQHPSIHHLIEQLIHSSNIQPSSI